MGGFWGMEIKNSTCMENESANQGIEINLAHYSTRGNIKPLSSFKISDSNFRFPGKMRLPM